MTSQLIDPPRPAHADDASQDAAARRLLRSVSEMDRPSAPERPRRDRGVADLDSRARTHLANERTYLAWLRTGLGSIALGAAVAHVANLGTIGGIEAKLVVAALLAVAGMAIVVIGRSRFATAVVAIEDGKWQPATRSLDLATGMVALLAAAVLVALVASA